MSHRLKVIEASKTDRTVADFHERFTHGEFDSWDSMLCELVSHMAYEKELLIGKFETDE